MTEEVKEELAEKLEAPSEPQVIQVGMDYRPGWETDAELDCLLGHDTDHAGTRPVRRTQDGLVNAPSYHQEPELVKRLLRGEGVEEWLHCRTVDTRRRTRLADPFVSEQVLVFSWKGALHATAPQLTKEAALACALWSILNISHQ